MQLQYESTGLAQIRAFASSARCVHCGEWMVAPLLSEFVEDGEIRHHWVCDGCGETTCTIIPLTEE
jgi:hypothetical protein